MKKILFVSYGGGHVEALYPVFKNLSNTPNIHVEFLALTTAAIKFRKLGDSYIGFKDLYAYASQGAIDYGKKLVGKKNLDSLVSYYESVAYMGISYSCLVEELGKTEAKRRFENRGGRQCFYPKPFFKRWLSDKRPDLIVTTNSPRSERAAIDAACELDIPSICLIDLFALQEIKWIGLPGYAKKLCVLSESIKSRFIDYGRNESEVTVTGNPAFDALANIALDNHRNEFRQRKGWSDVDKVVLWASNVEPEIHPFTGVKGDVTLPMKIETILQVGVANYDNWRLVIRPHPNDIRKPIIEANNVEISPASESLEELLSAVDCVVVMSSTVGLQAVLLNKPLVNIKASIFSADAPYDEMGMAIGVDSLDSLLLAVAKSLECGQHATGLPPIGTATDNVTREIYNMLEMT